MKNFVFLLTVMVCLVVISVTNSSAQTTSCTLVQNKCQGSCDPFYWGPDLTHPQPRVAGTPTCNKVKIKEEHGKPIFECHCFLIVTTTGCREEVCEETGCPSVYASFGDATTDTKPITGICITQKAGNLNNCACKYELKD
jgi:hypothetical protein